MLLIRIIFFVLGVALVAEAVLSAIKTLVLPRGAPNVITGFVFRSFRSLFELRLKSQRDYNHRDRIMAYYAPLSVIALLPTWLLLILIGYTAMFWALGAGSWYQAFRISGSSLLTLGYASVDVFPFTILEFSEATLGLMLVALLIAYLPSMYHAFSRREATITLLEVRAGDPPSAEELIARYHRIHGLDQLAGQWSTWEVWFTELQESHTSLAALVFFRSPQENHSWIIAAAAVLDAAALTRSAVDIPRDPSADLCIRAGFLALRAIADFFRIPYNPDPRYPEEPIHIQRDEFEATLQRLAGHGVPIKADRDQAWQDFAGWRVNYDSLIQPLANLTMAPAAPWTGERDYE